MMNGNIQYLEGEMTVLGDAIPNGFTIPNMLAAKQALDSLGIHSINPSKYSYYALLCKIQSIEF